MKKKVKQWKKRFASLLMCIAVLAVSLQLPAVTAQAEETAGTTRDETSSDVDEAENLIKNGRFEDGFNNWNPYFLESSSGSAQVTEDFMARFDISWFAKWHSEWGVYEVEWSVILEQKQISVMGGKTYTIHFWAKSTAERPVILEIDGNKHFLHLTSELQEFTVNYDNTKGTDKNVDLKIHMGMIKTDDDGNTTGIGTESLEGHSLFFTDFSMIDAAGGEIGTVQKPRIIGIEDGEICSIPVSVRVNYKKDYTVILTRNGSEIPYTVGELIKDDGDYVLTVTDAEDPSIQTVKRFNITKMIDTSKEYYIIVSKATGKVIQTSGTFDGAPIIQSTFIGDPGQFFTMEEMGQGYKVIRALSTGKVISVAGASNENDAKLEQAEYTGADSQLWKEISVPQGFVKLSNKASRKVIDIPGAAKTEGLQLQQYKNSGIADEAQSSVDGQRFDLIKVTDIMQYMETESVPETEADWKENAFITPIADELNPAGPIAVEWYRAPGDVSNYDIYFDGEKCKTVAATGEEKLKTEDKDIYSTAVKSHTMKIAANYTDGRTVETKEINFYISKKGVGWATLHRTEDMNLSWYYRWSTDPAIGTDKKLTFVPMIWGNFGDDWLADPENKKYGTVLSFNEPDWSDQSNVPVTKELAQAWVERYNRIHGTNNTAPKSLEESWQPFMDSGLRIGSPATALAPPYCLGQIQMNEVDGPDDWWKQFQNLMDSRDDWDYDFTAIHSYNGDCGAKGFLDMIDETHRMTGKPIWVTEFGVAEWGQGLWEGNNAETQKQVKNFIIEVIKGLEERDFVERYAWFPFDPNDAYGGASGIFDYATGELNELGKTYAMLGLPEGYEGTVYDLDGEIEPPAQQEEEIAVTDVAITGEKPTLFIGETLQLSADVMPENASNRAVTWSSSDPTIAKVDQTGKVTVAKAGTVTITAKAGSIEKSIVIRAIKPTVKWNVSYKTCSLQINKSTTALKAVGLENGDEIVSYTSSNEKIATVSKKGKIKAKKTTGKTKITVTTKYGAKAEITIKVQKKPVKVKKLTVNKTKVSLKKGKTFQLSVTKNYITSLYKVTYTSSNKKIATVSSKGKIKAKKKGTAYITVKCQNKTKKVKVTVK